MSWFTMIWTDGSKITYSRIEAHTHFQATGQFDSENRTLEITRKLLAVVRSEAMQLLDEHPEHYMDIRVLNK